MTRLLFTKVPVISKWFNNFWCPPPHSYLRNKAQDLGLSGVSLFKLSKWSMYQSQANSSFGLCWKYGTMSVQNCARKAPQQQVPKLFHTTAKRQFYPVFLIIGKAATKFLAILTGRGLRKWWRALPKDRRLYFKEAIQRNRIKISGFTIGGLLLFIVYYESHIQETPITGRKRFIAFTQSQFQKIADFELQLQMEMCKDGILPNNHPACLKVARVANRLLRGNKDIKQIYDKSWSITVVDNPVENAFVLPNGNIFVLTGLLKFCETDDQLGVILAHEMAHCIMDHGAEQVSMGHLLDFVVIAALAAIWTFVPSDGLAAVTQWFFHKVTQILLELPYNRKLETEADEVGLQLAAKSCFDVRECSAFWAKMSILKKDEPKESDWWSTHPSHESRSALLDSAMEKAVKVRQECGCPKLPDLDPRIVVQMMKRQIEEDLAKSQNRTGNIKLTI